MTDSLTVAQDRDTTVLLYERNELLRTARDQQIDFALETQEIHHVRTRLQQVDGLLRYIGKPAKRFSPDGHNAFVAICGFGATFEQNRVAGLECQRSDLRNDIGPRFKHKGILKRGLAWFDATFRGLRTAIRFRLSKR